MKKRGKFLNLLKISRGKFEIGIIMKMKNLGDFLRFKTQNSDLNCLIA